jgi:excisionase family DNA binding protein
MRSRTTKPKGGFSKETVHPHLALNATDDRRLTRLLLTADEAAFALAISPRTLWTLTNAGQIPCVHLGRCVRYAPDALQDWIREQPK